MAGVGAAGLLLVNLPASGQLSNDTSTFNGEVAQTCSFDLEDTAPLIYQSSNWLAGGYEFNLTTNLPNIRMSLSEISVGSEPAPISSEISKIVSLFHREGNLYTNIAATNNNRNLSDPLVVSTSSANTFRISMSVMTTNRVDNRYLLAPGNYSYSVTLSCLLS